MDIISAGQGKVYLRLGMLKITGQKMMGMWNGRQGKALGKRSTLATETEGTDIGTAGLRTPISLDMKCGKVAPFLPSASSWHQGLRPVAEGFGSFIHQQFNN